MPLLGKCQACGKTVSIGSLQGAPGALFIRYQCPHCETEQREIIALAIEEMEMEKRENNKEKKEVTEPETKEAEPEKTE